MNTLTITSKGITGYVLNVYKNPIFSDTPHLGFIECIHIGRIDEGIIQRIYMRKIVILIIW